MVISSNFDPEEVTPAKVNTAQDAANLMGLDLSAGEAEIESRFRELSLRWHPDATQLDFNTTSLFTALSKSRDMMLSSLGERESEEQAQEARTKDAPPSPGTGGFSEEAASKRDQYRELVPIVKVFFVEQILGIEINAQTLGDAVQSGEVSTQQINKVEDILRQNYGVPELELDDIARVVASLIVQGSISLGNVDKFAKTTGVFGGRGREGSFKTGGSSGTFRKGGGGGVFKR